MPNVIVAIPTFRRPQGLERLLTALANLETGANVSVLVADNDAERREGLGVCEAVRARGYRWKLESIAVSERGIAQARNALAEHILRHSDAEFVAMLDDDEWPAPGWLAGFLKVRHDTDADAVHGTILREFETAPGAWALGCSGVAPMQAESGPVDMIPGTGNVFLCRSCLEDLPKPCFDPGFALTGGEDKDFFSRLKKLGKRFAWSDEAVCYAYVPPSRANLPWALKRAYRVGNSDMRVLIKHERAAVLVRELAKIAGVFLLFPAMLVAALPFARRRAEPLCKLYRACGKSAAFFGSHYNEYATTHGC